MGLLCCYCADIYYIKIDALLADSLLRVEQLELLDCTYRISKGHVAFTIMFYGGVIAVTFICLRIVHISLSLSLSLSLSHVLFSILFVFCFTSSRSKTFCSYEEGEGL